MPLTINKPGGVVVRMKDGHNVTYPYGAEVNPSELDPASKETLKSWADEEPRQAPLDWSPVQSAHADAAKITVGDVNSSAHVVPGNYGELSEDDAVACMRALEAHPRSQAILVLHEIVNYGRKRVVEQASGAAQQSAKELIAGTPEMDLHRQYLVVDEPLVDLGAEDENKVEAKTKTEEPSPEDTPATDLKGEALDSEGKRLEIEGFSTLNADDKRDAVARAREASADDATGQTPPPTS